MKFCKARNHKRHIGQCDNRQVIWEQIFCEHVSIHNSWHFYGGQAMKRPSEMESDSLTMQILGSVDLLTLIAADLTPPQLAPLMSTSKLVRQGCLCNAIWQRYVGGVPRPGALEGELYRSYKNLTQGNFLLDSAFPSDAFPSYSEYEYLVSLESHFQLLRRLGWSFTHR